jgi:hypothetical protein
MLSHWYDLYVADDTYVLMQKKLQRDGRGTNSIKINCNL